MICIAHKSCLQLFFQHRIVLMQLYVNLLVKSCCRYTPIRTLGPLSKGASLSYNHVFNVQVLNSISSTEHTHYLPPFIAS